MSMRFQKRFFNLIPQICQQQNMSKLDPNIDIKGTENPTPTVGCTNNIKDPLANGNELFCKDDFGDALLLRNQFTNIKEGATLIRRNNALMVSGSHALQTEHLKKIPGPKLELFDQMSKKIPIIKSQVATSFMHFLYRFPLGPGSYFTWAKDIRPYNNLFEKYGDIVGLRGPLGGDIVLLRRPEHFNIILDDKNEEFSSQSCFLDSLEAYAQQNLAAAGVHSVKPISSTEESFQELNFVKNFKMSEEKDSVSNDVIKRIEELNQLQYEIPPDFYIELCKWGLSWQQRLMFDKESISFLDQQQLKSGSEGAKILSAFVEASEALRKCESGFQLWRIYNTSPWEKLVSSCDSLCGSFIKMILKVEAGIAKEEYSELDTGVAKHLIMSRNANLDYILLYMLEATLVGVNVTAFTMGFLLYHLAKSPRVQTKLHEEIKNVIGKDKHINMKYDEIDKLKYLKACVKEALRLQLPIPFSIRKLHKDISISNYLIPKDTYIVMAHENACLSKDNFEEPERFLPERWMTATAQNLIDPLNIQPYGSGTCSTIVKNLAEKQMCLLTAKIIKNFWVFYSYDDITSDEKILAMPTHPFKFIFEKRLK